MKKTVEEYYCDRCGDKFERRNCLIMENVSYTASGYSDGGSGGHTVRDQEFCGTCSKTLYDFLRKNK